MFLSINKRFATAIQFMRRCSYLQNSLVVTTIIIIMINFVIVTAIIIIILIHNIIDCVIITINLTIIFVNHRSNSPGARDGNRTETKLSGTCPLNSAEDNEGASPVADSVLRTEGRVNPQGNKVSRV